VASSVAQVQVSAIRSPGLSGGADDPGADVQGSAAQLLGFGGGEFAVQDQDLRLREEVDAGEGDFQPGSVDREDP
jgi:hypothetical protein